jgi:hypothetical protein
MAHFYSTNKYFIIATMSGPIVDWKFHVNIILEIKKSITKLNSDKSLSVKYKFSQKKH